MGSVGEAAMGQRDEGRDQGREKGGRLGDSTGYRVSSITNQLEVHIPHPVS